MRPAVVRLCSLLLLCTAAAAAGAGDLAELLQSYREQGVQSFDPRTGEALWLKDFGGTSCASCHTDSPRNPGRHERTGKPIEPMAPSVNPTRLTDITEMRKWLLRNCKSTLGRECTAQEKGDVLTWLHHQ
jgi:hypothetical protein